MPLKFFEYFGRGTLKKLLPLIKLKQVNQKKVKVKTAENSKKLFKLGKF